MNILVCEDEEIMLTALEFRLRKHGYDVKIANDGKKAIKALTENMPDLIVADIMMPFVSGIEIIDYVRKDLKSNVPIIIISAIEEDETILNAFSKGANDFISKPFKPTELVLRIRRLLNEG